MVIMKNSKTVQVIKDLLGSVGINTKDIFIGNLTISDEQDEEYARRISEKLLPQSKSSVTKGVGKNRYNLIRENRKNMRGLKDVNGA
jgi:hypothetical protein